MNLWTDVAIANLQRVRPNPRDLEERFSCTQCGAEKPESDFRFIEVDDRFVRDKMCRACRSRHEADARNARRGHGVARRLMKDEIRALVLQHLAGNIATIRQMDSALPASRTSLERTIKALREDGIVIQVGTKKTGTNSKIPIYGLTQGAECAGKDI